MSDQAQLCKKEKAMSLVRYGTVPYLLILVDTYGTYLFDFIIINCGKHRMHENSSLLICVKGSHKSANSCL
jgi:hypothetical protein